MTSRLSIAFGLLCVLFSCVLAGSTPSDARETGSTSLLSSPKRDTAAARLLVPFFEVDTTNAAGATTFFSIRNEISQPVEIRISLHTSVSPQSPFHSEMMTLAPKQIQAINVRTRPNLVADADGIARGYVIVETVAGEAVIQGDYFQITPNEAFANGSRLVNIDPQSDSTDLCSVFTIRFLNGGGFSGGTELTLWLDLAVAPQGTEVLSYDVYSEAGELTFSANLSLNEVTLRRTIAELTSLRPINFGAIEIRLNDGIRGHVSAVMRALGLYSVGLEASCGG